MRDIALSIVFLGLVIVAIGRPWVGLLVWSWMSYMAPHRLCYGFAYTFPFGAIITVVTVLSWLASPRKHSFPWTRETILEICFCLWISFTTLFALNHAAAGAHWQRAVTVQFMIFMTYLIIRNRVSIIGLVWTIVISLGFYGVKGALFTLAAGGKYMVLGPPATFIGDNNTIALALVMVIPLMHYLQMQSSNKWIRGGLIFAQFATALSVIDTYSRGGFLALGALGALLWLKGRHKLALTAAFVLFLPPMLLFMPNEWRERMKNIAHYDTDSSAEGRLNAWEFAINLVRERPLVGGGFRVFVSPAFRDYAPNPDDRHDAHSIYFEVLGEHGIPGLLLFLGMGVSCWWTARGVLRRARDIPDLRWLVDLVEMLKLSLFAYAVGGTFLSLAYFDLPYQLMALIVICRVLVGEHERAQRAESWRVANPTLELVGQA